MTRRLIPIITIDRNRRAIKTIGFKERVYIGDPLNIIRIFNEKEVDELCVLDIDATRDGRGPEFQYIEALASECFMPLAYGGGISKLTDCERLNRIGVEKFILRKASLDFGLVRAISSTFGTQATSICVDVKKKAGVHIAFSLDGDISLEIEEFVLKLIEAGAGEILLQSADRDGRRCGLDLELISRVSKVTNVPLVAAGGAAGIQHLSEAIGAGADAVASGSAFCFIGKIPGILITYPKPGLLKVLLRDPIDNPREAGTGI